MAQSSCHNCNIQVHNQMFLWTYWKAMHSSFIAQKCHYRNKYKSTNTAWQLQYCTLKLGQVAKLQSCSHQFGNDLNLQCTRRDIFEPMC